MEQLRMQLPQLTQRCGSMEIIKIPPKIQKSTVHRIKPALRIRQNRAGNAHAALL
jgi:hypothetical protein